MISFSWRARGVVLIFGGLLLKSGSRNTRQWRTGYVLKPLELSFAISLHTLLNTVTGMEPLSTTSAGKISTKARTKNMDNIPR